MLEDVLKKTFAVLGPWIDAERNLMEPDDRDNLYGELDTVVRRWNRGPA